jgi:hypothetical protein
VATDEQLTLCNLGDTFPEGGHFASLQYRTERKDKRAQSSKKAMDLQARSEADSTLRRTLGTAL